MYADAQLDREGKEHWRKKKIEKKNDIAPEDIHVPSFVRRHSASRAKMFDMHFDPESSGTFNIVVVVVVRIIVSVTVAIVVVVTKLAVWPVRARAVRSAIFVRLRSTERVEHE